MQFPVIMEKGRGFSCSKRERRFIRRKASRRCLRHSNSRVKSIALAIFSLPSEKRDKNNGKYDTI
jgi:hypothetical protein